MKFIDQAKIRVEAGNGGNGVISWRREKYVPKGGPDGGNGGHGGHVIFQADPQLSTLLDFRYKRIYKAQNGNPGEGNNMTGRSGKDEIVKVPVGTVVRELNSGDVLGDLVDPGQQIVIAKGGRGGLGNAEFKTSTNQAPRVQTNGTPGQIFDLELELKLLADVAIVGFPNAGKSTLISRISAAKPKIADYPFTTLVPNLGIVQAPEEHKSFVVADIPGLIEGASEGRGLGHQFLRHIERSNVLLFLLDGADPDNPPAEAFSILKEELRKYARELLAKPRIVAISKTDALLEEDIAALKKLTIDRRKPLMISAVAGNNLDELVRRLWKEVQAAKTANPVQADDDDPTDPATKADSANAGPSTAGRRRKATQE
jgi:GTPase